MSAVAERNEAATAVEQVLIGGDLSRLTPEHRLTYYRAVCESVGLNPLTKPFDYLTLSGRMVLYAKRDATDQLRRLHGVSVRIAKRETVEGVHIVTAQATDRGGRVDESTGAVTIAGLKADALANALMKAETKAKRRVTLSICGLGLLDESEIETIPGAKVETNHAAESPAALPAKRVESIPMDVARSLVARLQQLPGFSRDAWQPICNGVKVHELPAFVAPVLHAMCEQAMPLERIRKALQWLKRDSLDWLDDADCGRLLAAINKPAKQEPVTQAEEVTTNDGIVEEEV